MNIFACWNIENWFSLISTILVVIGGFFAWTQWTAGTKIKRAEFINQIIEKLRFDKEMANTMYIVEYTYDWYSDNFHNSELEYSIDKLLSYLSYICYLYATHNIRKTEFKILKYELNRVCVSPDVQGYLWNLYHFSKKRNMECTFQYLIDYGIKCGIIQNDFKRDDIQSYAKCLNF